MTRDKVKRFARSGHAYPEIPVLLGIVGLALAITLPDLVKGRWNDAFLKLLGLAGFIGVFFLLLARKRKR